jgi:ABC-type antimicrobial peptide transport system permease subunit
LSIPLLKGRFFTSQDNQNNLPVAIISENLAKAGWREADPVGERILLEGKWRTIVGLAGSTLKTSPFRFRPMTREIYLPYLQSAPTDMKILVRSTDASLSLGAVLRQQVRSLDVDQPLVDLQTMEQALLGFLAPFRLILLLMSLFGGIALLLAAGGLYGVIALFVSQRTREIGIRKALGAPNPEIMRMILKQGLRLIVIGLVPGLLLGMALAKVLPAEILGVGSLSPFYYLGALLILLLVSLSACFLPARRAACVDPLVALRQE